MVIFCLAYLFMWCDPPKVSTESPTQKMTQPLVIIDAQSGVVGKAGVETVIQPSGEWRRSRFWGTERREHLTSGQLSAEQLKQIADVVGSSGFEKLPDEFGATDPSLNPNPRYLAVKVGKVEKSLLVMPRATIESAAVKMNDENRRKTEDFGRLYKLIATLVDYDYTLPRNQK